MVVTLSKRGEGLYDTLRMELERCVNTLAKNCSGQGKDKVEWLSFFVTTCKWFESKIVSILLYPLSPAP